MILLNKKGNATFVFVTVILLVISFFIYFTFFQSVNTIATDLDDLACRALIKGQSMAKTPLLGTYIFELNAKCKVDTIKNIDNKDKDTTLKPIADSMLRCWYRYGEGEEDLMSSWNTQGEWCFKCATLEYKNKQGPIFHYRDLIDWMSENEFQTKDGSMKYIDYLNVMVSASGESFENPNFEGISRSEEEGFEEFLQLYFDYAATLYHFSNSVERKIINPSEPIFVVNRYIKVDKEIEEKIIDSLKAGGVTGASFVALKTGGQLLKPTTIVNPQNLLRGVSRLGGPYVMGAIALVSYFYAETNRNYIQYVDVMTQEQFFRECGTERDIMERLK